MGHTASLRFLGAPLETTTRTKVAKICLLETSYNADFGVVLCWTWFGCIHARKTVEGLMSNLIASTLTHKHHLYNNNLAQQWFDSLPCLY